VRRASRTRCALARARVAAVCGRPERGVLRRARVRASAASHGAARPRHSQSADWSPSRLRRIALRQSARGRHPPTNRRTRGESRDGRVCPATAEPTAPKRCRTRSWQSWRPPSMHGCTRCPLHDIQAETDGSWTVWSGSVRGMHTIAGCASRRSRLRSWANARLPSSAGIQSAIKWYTSTAAVAAASGTW
jgi:hypothetical protein